MLLQFACADGLFIMHSSLFTSYFRDKERAKYILASLVSLGDWHMLCFQHWLTECSGIPEMSSVLNRQSHRSHLLYRVDLLPDLIQIFSSTRFSRFLLELTSRLHFNTGQSNSGPATNIAFY